ncbi:MAG: homoserine kinase [Anaerolineales bacterium]
MRDPVTVRAPATTANLGPGFDAVGLALDLWNETSFTIEGEAVTLEIMGEGKGQLLENEENLILRAMHRVYEVCRQPFPAGLCIRAQNRIPWNSGLGSSAAAIVSGLLAANALLDQPLSTGELLRLATQLEGHADNVVPALLGGLTVALRDADEVIARPLPWQPFHVTVIVPQFSLPTRTARKVLPPSVSLSQTSQHIARAILVTRAFAEGDLELLRQVMYDELHQPHRLPLIPGAAEALRVAEKWDAAVALSGAGPSLIAFSLADMPDLAKEMQEAFWHAGLLSRSYHLQITSECAQVLSLV